MSTATTSQAARWIYEPFAEPNPDRLADLRDTFARLRFTEPDICAVGGFDNMYELPRLASRADVLTDTGDPQSLLVQLFVDGVSIPWRVVRTTLSANDTALLVELGLLQSSTLDAEECTASVAIYPNQGLYLASDKHASLETVAQGIPGDIVYSAMTPETHRFIDLMPRSRCGDYLELCSGTGIAALLGARDFADRAWAIDVAERATRFARYNVALNALNNVTALAGDLYEPVRGQTFDVIVAHPPYVPSFETQMVFRDGGEDGEQITRRIIAGLGEHLRPGGEFHCDCMMTDRIDAPLETRIREMLGSAADEFDILLGQVDVVEIDTVLQRLTHSQDLSSAELARRRTALEGFGIERFVNAAFRIRRRQEAGMGAVVTRRRILSSETTSMHYDWYMQWAVESSSWSDATALLEARPRRVPGVELHSRSVCRDAGWSVVEASLVTRVPFAIEARCQMWFATLLSKCDGSATSREILQQLCTSGVIPPSASEQEFARLIGELADGGFVELDVFPFVA